MMTVGGTADKGKRLKRCLLLKSSKHYFRWNVDNPFLAGWVKDLVSIGFVLPGGRPVLLPLAPHTVVEG